MSIKSIQRALRRAKVLGTNTLKRVVKTSLDTAAELDALESLPEPEREALVVRAEAGEAVSAVKTVAASKTAEPDIEKALVEATKPDPRPVTAIIRHDFRSPPTQAAIGRALAAQMMALDADGRAAFYQRVGELKMETKAS